MQPAGLGTVRRYGLDWPRQLPEAYIEMLCAKKWREMPYCKAKLDDPDVHLLRACRLLFTPQQFKISPWTEQHAHDWCHETFCITWGCASSGKSNDYGCFAVLDWLADPTMTVTILASTSKEMLRIRTYESVMRYFKTLKASRAYQVPGKIIKQSMAIVAEDMPDEEAVTEKASIRGVAVQEGTVEEARANLQGAHLPYVRLIADELSQMREAVMEARINLMIGTRDFRFFGLCNPDSFFDLAARHSVPVGGWSSVNEDSDSWRTPHGLVRHHNGFRSPALTRPDDFPHLISQKNIDAVLQQVHGNMDHPQVWTMVRGFPAPQTIERTVLSFAEVQEHHMQEPVSWATDDRVVVAGLDPAFTNGGDNCVLRIVELGLGSDGGFLINILPPIFIEVKASVQEPVTYQIARQVIEKSLQHRFSLTDLGVDDSGTQSVADVIDREGQTTVVRFNSSARASDRPVSKLDKRPAKQAFSNLITELWYGAAELGRYGHLRGLDGDTAQQLCLRRIASAKPPYRLETKADTKKRLKKSPDEADGLVYALGALRVRHGVVPGEIWEPNRKMDDMPPHELDRFFGAQQLPVGADLGYESEDEGEGYREE